MGVQRIPLAAERKDARRSCSPRVTGGTQPGSAAEISIVLPTDTIATITPVLECLSILALGKRVEVVVVLPASESAAALDMNAQLAVRIHEVQSLYPLSAARAAGIRAATAPYVFTGETHSFPRPGMFEALLQAHAAGNAAVVPILENANPDGVVSWAGFLNGYAEWTEGARAGEIDYAPLFNVSYDRSFLVGLGAELEHTLSSGGDMMGRLRAAGCRVWLEPRARIEHWNIVHMRNWLPQRLVAGRVIASLRSRHWPIHRRVAFALASPLIPLVLLARIRKGIARSIRQKRVPLRVVPTIALGMLIQAAGEMAGYAAGVSARASRRYDEYEVRQLSYTDWDPR